MGIQASSVSITGYSGTGGIVTIPDTIGGCTVTAIGDSAFANQTAITGFNIPETVTSIGNYAFQNCSALKSLILPESVETLGYRMILGTGISSITIPKNVASCNYYYSTYSYRRDGPLAGASSLKEVVFEEGMTTIPESIASSYHNTSYIESVTIPSTVTSIGDYAFYYCVSLSNIYFYGNCPTFDGSYIFTNVVSNAFYPTNNATWSDVAANPDNYQFGGTITWSPWNPPSTGGGNTEQQQTKVYRIIVTEAETMGDISGATVSCNGIDYTTDSKGTAEFPYSGSNDSQITVSMASYYSRSFNISDIDAKTRTKIISIM